MKILMATAGGVVSGMEGWPEYGLAKELVKLGHDVEVFASTSVIKAFPHTKREETIEGIRVRRFNPVFPGSLAAMLRGDWDLIHSHHLGYIAPISSYAALRKKIKAIPLVHTVHGIYHNPLLVQSPDDPFSGKIRNSIQKAFSLFHPVNWFVHMPLTSADAVTALTKWEAQTLEKLGIEKAKIYVIPNGVDLEKFRRKAKGFKEKHGIDGEIILFVGQPTKRKGAEYLIRAVPNVVKEFPDVTFAFIGYRRDESLETLCKELGIEGHVKFFGFLPEEEKIAAYKEADVFAFPTLYEGFGIVFIEAMAAGCPIVTTDVAGNKEIVGNGRNGLLVEPRNPDELAKACIRLLKNKSLARSIGRNNLIDSKRYSWKAVSKMYTKTYENLVL